MVRLRSVRLVGRDAEMEQLRRAAVRARSGDPAMVLVEGEAGIGKTRLVTEAISTLAAPTDLAAVGGGFALGAGEIPFVAVSRVVRELARQAGPAAVLEAGGPAIEVLAPGLTGRPQVEHGREEVLDSFSTMVERLARERMLWLVFEDLHWVDSSSRDLIAYLIRSVRSCRLMVICTRRTHDEPPSSQLLDFVAELVRHPRGDRMILPRLTRDQVAQQVADIADQAPEPALLEIIAARSQGNPFLTEELVAAGPDGHNVVGDLLMARVLGLGADARLVVQAAAVGDGHAEHSLLARVCEQPAGDFAAAVAAAAASSVLETDPSGDGYTFRHALLREAVDSALLPAQRQHWHRRWAEELEADPGRMEAGPAQIAAAEHWYRTDDPVRAFQATLRAENAAWGMRASPEQAQLNLRLIELLPRVPEEERGQGLVRLDAAWTAVWALIRSGSTAEALALAERELEQPEAVSEPAWRIYLELVRRFCASRLGRQLSEAFDVDADVAELLQAPPNNLVTEALLWYREVLLEIGEVAQADRLLNRAVEVADAMVSKEMAGEIRSRNNPPDGVSTAVKGRMMVEVHLAWSEWVHGSSEEALTRVQSLLPTASKPGAYDAQDDAVLNSYATMLAELGRCREAVAILRQAMHLLGPADANSEVWLDLVARLAGSLFALGEWSEVDEWLKAAQRLESGSPGVLAIVHAALCRARGDLEAAETWLGSSATAADENGGAVTGPHAWLLADLAAARGDLARARELLEPSWAHQDRDLECCPEVNPFLLAARLEADAPDAESPGRVARIQERAERMAKRGDLGVAWTAHLEAESLRAGGSTDPEPWSRARAAWARIAQPHQEGWALLRHAECLVATGDRSGATASLTGALRIAQRLRALPLLDAVARLARRARLEVDVDSLPRAHGSSLTERELDVLRLLTEGYSNPRIAATLFISTKTASVHVSHILTKLGVANRAEAASVAVRRGLVDERESSGMGRPSGAAGG